MPTPSGGSFYAPISLFVLGVVTLATSIANIHIPLAINVVMSIIVVFVGADGVKSGVLIGLLGIVLGYSWVLLAQHKGRIDV